MSFRWLAFFSAAAAGVSFFLAAAPIASGKEGVEARLKTPLPLDASPGQKITVAWTLGYVDEEGKRQPLTALGIFVRLRSATGEAPSTAFADQGPLGHYAAEVTVPRGGIGGIKIGIRGTTDELFPLKNDPFATSRDAAAAPTDEPTWGRSFATWLAAGLLLASLVALGVLAAMRRRRRGASRRQGQSGLDGAGRP